MEPAEKPEYIEQHDGEFRLGWKYTHEYRTYRVLQTIFKSAVTTTCFFFKRF